MKRLAIAVLLATMTAAGLGQTFTDCKSDGGMGNQDGYRTTSKIFQCKEGRIELKGYWNLTIEYGQVYRTHLGEIDDHPEPATIFERDFFTWCRSSPHELSMVDTSARAGHARVDMRHWIPDPMKYPACTAMHMGQLP